MAFCLLPAKIEEFKKALKDKDINMADLLHMTTEERTKLLEKYAGDSAKQVNTLFEEKLVLKNKIQGLKNWASKVGEIGRYDPAKKAEIDKMISDFRSKQMERIFSPKEEEAFLADLAEKKLGVGVSEEEAKNIFELTTKSEELKNNFNPETKEWKSPEARKDYGASKVAMENYVEHLKNPELTLRESFGEGFRELNQTWKENKSKAAWDATKKAATIISDNSVAMVASLDDSFMGRQGLKTLFTHPSVWYDGAKNSITDFAKTLGGKDTMDALMADIYSNPNYMDKSYEIAGIIPKTEEQFPTSLPERIWGAGRVFKASEVAFKGSGLRMRTGLYDMVSEMAKTNGVDMTDKYQIKSIGKMINALTARGQWGKTGEPAIVRLIMWAPKMLKGNIDVLTAHAGQDMSSFARKEAAKNLGKIVMTTAGIMTMANAIKPGSAELDPRSSDFGKIKIGNTRFDITAGASSLIVLGARVATSLTNVTGLTDVSNVKSSTGIYSKYGTKYGQQNAFNAVIDFMTNKTTPAMGILADMLKQQAFGGKKLTLGGEISSKFVPISIQNAINLKDDNSVQAVSGVILDVFGIGSSTYAPSEKDWEMSDTKELTGFKDKVGSIRFTKANEEVNKNTSDAINKIKNDPTYKSLSDEDKQKKIDKIKELEKNKVFVNYGYTPTTKLKVMKLMQDKKTMSSAEFQKNLSQYYEDKGVMSEYNQSFRDEKTGVTEDEKDLRNKKVDDRVSIIKDEYNKLKTPQEKNDLLKNYRIKGILTESVEDNFWKSNK